MRKKGAKGAAAGGGFGWQVGRDAGRAFSRSIGL